MRKKDIFNFLKKIFKSINEVYIALVSITLYFFFKPFIILLKKILSKKNYEKISFILITFINYFYITERIQLKRNNKIKYDIKKYRDVYDRGGLNLYFKYFSPNEIITNKKILDFGCGVGGKDFELIKYSPKKIVGIDLSNRNIKYAKELINGLNKDKLFFYNKDISSINEKFDTIISYTVFEHVNKNLLLTVLNKMYTLLNKNGIILIVFNHYNDKLGMHLKEYIYHPWPQTLFEEKILFEYWNKNFFEDDKVNNKSYFSIEYKHGLAKHNSDCFMNLNKISIYEFEKIIKKTKFKYLGKDLYSKSLLLKIMPFLPKKYLIGSAVYYLKNED